MFRRGNYTLNVTTEDGPDCEQLVYAMVLVARAEVTFTVLRRWNGEVLIALTGSRLDVEKVHDVGRQRGMW